MKHNVYIQWVLKKKYNNKCIHARRIRANQLKCRVCMHEHQTYKRTNQQTNTQTHTHMIRSINRLEEKRNRWLSNVIYRFFFSRRCSMVDRNSKKWKNCCNLQTKRWLTISSLTYQIVIVVSLNNTDDDNDVHYERLTTDRTTTATDANGISNIEI